MSSRHKKKNEERDLGLRQHKKEWIGYRRKWNDNSWMEKKKNKKAERKRKKTKNHILKREEKRTNKLWEINKWATTTARIGSFVFDFFPVLFLLMFFSGNQITVLENEALIADATGIPDRWKCTHCQRVSFLCHTRVSSVRTLWGWPFLQTNESSSIETRVDLPYRSIYCKSKT